MGNNNPQWPLPWNLFSSHLSAEYLQCDGWCFSYREITHEWKIFTPISLSLLHRPLWGSIQVGEPQLEQVKAGSLRAVSEICRHNHGHSLAHRDFHRASLRPLCWDLPPKAGPPPLPQLLEKNRGIEPPTSLMGSRGSWGITDHLPSHAHWHCYGGDLLCLLNPLKLIFDYVLCHFKSALFAST